MKRKHLPPGFSLTELLVALALLATLALLGTALVSGTRERSHATRCMRNLQTWGSALFLYVAENNGRLPSVAPWGDGRRWNHPDAPLARLIHSGTWTTPMYQNWNRGNDFNGCPAYPDTPISYATTSRYYSYVASHVWFNPANRLNTIPNPASIILITDATHASLQSIFTTANYHTTIGYPHRGKTQALFADGHIATVEQVSASQVK